MNVAQTPKPAISWPALLVGLGLTLPLLGILLSGLFHDPHDLGNPLEDETAPRFTLPRLDGQGTLSLEQLRGKPTIINFWATWCQSCPLEHPVLEQAAREFGDQVQFVGIAYEDKSERLSAWLQRANRGRPSAYPTLIDVGGKVAVAYGVYGVPETYFVDAQGTVKHKKTGPFLPSADPTADGRLELRRILGEML
ncbi:MAG: thiol:disulfide interchange protein [Rickettsiales bacterium]|nr:thiol:disulfide interchange protein [Rickettsiales bacterium]|tara:strand:- start:107 stop:691 length:585 start_codon:yes stop_codon:yes gene_type:complete